MSVFNPTQKITAKLFYNLVAQLEGDERVVAVKALSVLIPVTEDGFMTVNGTAPRTDFYVQCFDTLMGVAISLKMLEDDGLVPEMDEVRQVKAVKRLGEADAALHRLESILAMSPKPSMSEN